MDVSVTTTTESVFLTKITEITDEILPTMLPTSKSLTFSTLDYIIFAMMLLLSGLIGVYFGFISKKKQNNTAEYLLGGKTMGAFPVSASLIAGHVSGVTILGVPSEMYANGSQYWAFPICAFAVAIAMAYVYLPVFYELQVTSCFTYLERRFDRKVRLVASLLYTISCIIFIPIVIYVPALAFSQVTGINLHMITPVISIICIFYTTVGGLRAVVWTDTLQFILMIAAILAVIVIGTMSVGGLSNAWNIADNGGRVIFFNMNPDPLVRTSFWTVSFGLSVMWISNLGVSQSCIQRFLSVPNLKEAKKTLIYFTFGLIFIKSCSCLTGFLMYAEYEKCDPVSIGVVKKHDQMLPYYVMDIAGSIPGLPGLFIAGIFSAALSTMSASLNTLAGTIYEDFLRNRLPNASEKKASNIMKMIVVVLGVVELALVFIVEKLGSVFHLAISFSGVTAGTLLAMFTIGMFFKQANTKGIISGAITSLLGVGAILVGAQMVPKPPTLPFRTDGCEGDFFNSTILEATTTVIPDIASDPHWVFRISFMYYSLIGLVLTFVVAYPISLLTGGTQDLDEILLTPIVRSQRYKDKLNEIREDVKYAELDLALKELKTIE